MENTAATVGTKSETPSIMTPNAASSAPMAMHVAFPYIDILRYGGTPPVSSNGEIRFCCPDADVINVFRLDVIQEL